MENLLFVGQLQDMVIIYTDKEQCRYGEDPLFRYNNYIQLSCSFDDAQEIAKKIKFIYSSLKTNNLCARNILRETQV